MNEFLLKVRLEATDPTLEPEMEPDLKVEFAHTDNDYGNGWYMGIRGKGFPATAYDIRYDRDFDPSMKGLYIAQWAYNYWDGHDGGYKVRSLSIEEVRA